MDQFHSDPLIKGDLRDDPAVGFILEQVLLPREARGYTPPTDPEWTNQWTLVCANNVLYLQVFII